MSTEMIVGVAFFAAMPVVFLVWATWQARSTWQRAERHLGR